ncbi:hypothetical protein B0H14DRAFT_2743222, partial [Mycena olivaceomarginata]
HDHRRCLHRAHWAHHSHCLRCPRRHRKVPDHPRYVPLHADRHGLRHRTFQGEHIPAGRRQYRCTKLFVVETNSGVHVIVDSTLTVSHVYMYFYLFINVGTLVGQITMVYSRSILALASILLDHISIICSDKKCAV